MYANVFSFRVFSPLTLSLSKGRPFMVRQAHHERTPELSHHERTPELSFISLLADYRQANSTEVLNGSDVSSFRRKPESIAHGEIPAFAGMTGNMGMTGMTGDAGITVMRE